MYLPAVDYVAFRIEMSQFHDSPRKKLPPRSLPFTAIALDQPHIPRRISPPIFSILEPIRKSITPPQDFFEIKIERSQ